MPQFILLTRVSAQSLHQPKSFETLERHVVDQVRRACPEVRWIANYVDLDFRSLASYSRAALAQIATEPDAFVGVAARRVLERTEW